MDCTKLVAAAALALGLGAGQARGVGGERSLEEFGDISTKQAASEALKKATTELMATGGGVLVIPADAPADLKVWNTSQQELNGPAVTIMDFREGRLRYHVPPIGTKETNGWGGLQVNRMLNMGGGTLQHCTTTGAESINSYAVSGATSYIATLTEPVVAGADQRVYVDLIRGIWPGQFLNVTSSVMSYKPPYDRVTVKQVGWDPDSRRNYFVADFEHDHPAGALVYNKHNVMALKVNGYSNCDNQTAGLLGVVQHNYAVGDNFVISGMMKYMSDVFCGFGDEGAVVINAETVGVLNFFASTVEAVDWSTDEITYAKGLSMPHTLSNSRPLINMNREKWITAGHVLVVPPGKSYNGLRYDGRIGGPGNAFNYQGGLILGSKDCGWTDAIVGRFFCVTDPTEVILPNDTSMAGGYAKLPRRPVYRWYRVRKHEILDDGSHRIRILRIRWSAVAAGAPRLFVDENYTWDDHERPLNYAIAPGGWVYDISQGWADTTQSGGNLYWEHPRKIRVVPTGDRGTRFDFEPGDEIEQPVGPDPWQPRPVRIRQFDQMPNTMEGASISVQQNGRVQVTDGLRLTSGARRREQLVKRKDRKPAYDTMVNLHALARAGIRFAGDLLEAAIIFEQPEGRAQPMLWRKDTGNTVSLTVPPDSGRFTFAGGDLDLTGRSVQRVSGLSGTDEPASNLRGIDLPVGAGATELGVRFARPEADARYAVSVTPNWLTPYCVANKTEGGFTVRFGAEAPADAMADWIIVR